jgi:Raf kinase inhibitor-like YbhB/YbcL family protein
MKGILRAVPILATTWAAAALAQETEPMTLSSPAFENGGALPARYSCEGGGVSPPLRWSHLPPGTRSLALVVSDPDAPGGNFVHWVLYDLPPDMGGLPAGIAQQELPPGAAQGRNGKGALGWTPPCPPTGSHRYRFVLYALGNRVEGLSQPDERDLNASMRGRILGQAELVGVYKKAR